MRQLHLQDPNMSGPDVADWQTFLKGQGILAGTVDGHFGPQSDQATRTFQSRAGLTADGIVGPGTMAKAVAAGYQSTTRANLFGMDASQNCAGFAARIAAAGMAFVARYYSDSSTKALTLDEAQKLSAAGLDLVAVFEDRNNSADLFSTAVGESHAAKALQLAAAVGQPAGSAIYFAVDFNPAQADLDGPISDYFTGVKSIFDAGPVQYSIGVYGSGLTCRVIRDSGLASLTWLCGSTGFREYASFVAQADIVQLTPERLLPGVVNIDDDIAQSSAYGAFRVSQSLPAGVTAT